jgi:oxaloacetate decarboxylase (Na+ extruding) subunit gamma
MIIEGLKLMVVGMTTVLLFLILMVVLIQLVAMLTKGVTARELQAIQDERERLRQEKERQKSAAAADQDEDIVVITAAIAAFEAERAAALR